MIDLHPATKVLMELVEGVRDDQLDAPTPCANTSIAALLDHVDGLAYAFTAAAKKETGQATRATPSADHLVPDWRTRIPERLAALADAWADERAWDGTTHLVGQDLPAQVAALITIDEVVVHGWDVAVASGQPFTADAQLVEAALGFVRPQVEQHPEGTPGLFGPSLPVPDDASPLHRLLRSTGRDPAWHPSGPMADALTAD